jgi:hypothetical protein
MVGFINNHGEPNGLLILKEIYEILLLQGDEYISPIINNFFID